MSLFAKKGFPGTPWKIVNKINSSKLTPTQKTILRAVADTSIGYRVKYANVSMYEIAKHMGMKRSNVQRTIRSLEVLGLLISRETDGKKMYGLKWVAVHYENYPKKMIGMYRGNQGKGIGVSDCPDKRKAVSTEVAEVSSGESFETPKPFTREEKKVMDEGIANFRKNLPKSVTGINNPEHQTGSCLALV